MPYASGSAPVELTFIGSGNAFAPERCWSGFLLNGRSLFDAPPTTLLSLKRLGVDLTAIDTIFLSHFHADHFYGIPFLILEYAHLTRRHSDLTIVGPPGVADKVESLIEFGYPGLSSRAVDYQRRYIEVSDKASGTAGNLSYRAVQMKHAERHLQCFGYLVDAGGFQLGYTGDTEWCDGLLWLANNADALVVDCTYPAGRRQPEHLSFEEIADLRQATNARTFFILTHLGGRQTNGGLPRVLVANDLGTITLAASVTG